MDIIAFRFKKETTEANNVTFLSWKIKQVETPPTDNLVDIKVAWLHCSLFCAFAWLIYLAVGERSRMTHWMFSFLLVNIYVIFSMFVFSSGLTRERYRTAYTKFIEHYIFFFIGSSLLFPVISGKYYWTPMLLISGYKFFKAFI